MDRLARSREREWHRVEAVRARVRASLQTQPDGDPDAEWLIKRGGDPLHAWVKVVDRFEAALKGKPDPRTQADMINALWIAIGRPWVADLRREV